jgi:hypothetical protein
MATDPTFAQRLNTPGGAAAIGSIGNAINAIIDGNAQRDMFARQTQQIREQVAFDRKVMEEQAALRAQEVQRQQMLARAAGDAFMRSLGAFKNTEGSIGQAGSSIADTFRAALARQAPASNAPAASGAVADRIASATDRASADVAGEAERLAAVQGVARAFTDSGMAVDRENQLASVLRNFAGGSAGASQAEIQSRAGKLLQPKLVKPTESMLGDFFVGLSQLGVKAANRPAPAAAPTSPYALPIPSAPSMDLRLGSGIGASFDRPSGIGIRLGNRIIGDN